MNTREALDILFKEKMSLSSETINLKNSNNRTLSRGVKSKMDIPPFSVSSMDGFALRKKDLIKTDCLKLIGTSPAGDNKNFSLEKNECVKIFTGSKLPSCCDFILLKENAKQLKNSVYPKHFATVKSSDTKKYFIDI